MIEQGGEALDQKLQIMEQFQFKMLDKLERKINLDSTLLEWDSKITKNMGFTEWKEFLDEIDDNKL